MEGTTFPHPPPPLLAGFVTGLTFNQLPVVDFHLLCRLLLDCDCPEDLLGGLRARRHKHVHQDAVGVLATSGGDYFIGGFDSGFWAKTRTEFIK